MRRRLLASTVILFLVLCIGYWLIWHESDGSRQVLPARVAPIERKHQASVRAGAVQLPENVVHPEAQFYGRVLDEDGVPVPHANVRYSRPPQPEDEQPKALGPDRYMKTDGIGKFSISGIRARFLDIGVWAQGYYATEKSTGRFYFSETSEYGPPGSAKVTVHDPDSAKPVEFRLRRKGQTDPMYAVSRSVKLEGVVRLSVEHEPALDVPGHHFIEFRGTLDSANKQIDRATNKEYFDWNVEVIVPGGGLKIRNSHEELVAPEEGYKERMQFGFRAGDRQNWRRNRDVDLFVKFADETYGRFQLRLRAFDENIRVSIDSLYNPGKGRSVEFDAAKKLKLRTE